MMIGKAHFRVRGVTCGKCAKIHRWYLYRVWREGKKLKEEYVGKCDQYGNTATHAWEETFKRHQEYTSWKDDFKKWQQTNQTQPHLKRSPYAVLGIRTTATRAEITKAYRDLVKRYHPDRNKAADPRIIVEINVAYQTLVK